jgi:DNA-binding transcriptional MocR family regulator
LRKWNVEFVTPSHGLFLFAKLAKGVRSAEEEKRFFDGLAVKGVKVAQGTWFRGVDGEFGWARVGFAVASRELDVAIRRLGEVLERM